MEFEEKTLSRKEIYQGPIFKLVQDQVELPEGKGTAQRDLIFHNGAVCVLAVTDEQKLILVKQYRKAYRGSLLRNSSRKVGSRRKYRPCCSSPS